MKLTISPGPGAQYSRYLRTHLHAAHKMLKPRLAELSLALVNDKRMSELHQRFMKISGPTDVLTFPLELDSRRRVLSGEVVLCLPEARRRAKEMKVAVQNELLLYALHGMLHLCGFDDRTATGFRRMHQMEDKILRRLGVGPVFEPKDEGRRMKDEKDPRPPARQKRSPQNSRHRNARFTTASSFRLPPSSRSPQ